MGNILQSKFLKILLTHMYIYWWCFVILSWPTRTLASTHLKMAKITKPTGLCFQYVGGLLVMQKNESYSNLPHDVEQVYILEQPKCPTRFGKRGIQIWYLACEFFNFRLLDGLLNLYAPLYVIFHGLLLISDLSYWFPGLWWQC